MLVGDRFLDNFVTFKTLVEDYYVEVSVIY